MAILSNNEHITKILDNEGNILVDLTTANGETQIIGKQPIVFNSDGSNLSDYEIFGNTGGVGNLNTTTNKYDIPIKIYGKNLLENNCSSETYNGLTVTVNADKSITINGTATDTLTLAVYNGSHSLYPEAYQPIEDGTYYLSGVPEGAEVGTYTMSYRYIPASGGSSQLGRIPIEGKTLDNTNGAYRKLAVYIAVWSGAVLDNVTFYPMLRLASVQNSTYESPKTPISATLSLNNPLTASQSVSKADAATEISTFDGINCIFVNTSVEPKNIRINNQNLTFISSGDIITYQVNYYNEDGSALYYTETVIADGNAKGYSGTPQKASTVQYTYTFAGWNTVENSSTVQNDALQNITNNKNLYAVFTEQTRTYSVYFYNEDNTLLQTITNVPYGGSATYTGETPFKSQDYEFTGWLPLPSNISGDTSCYAQFEKIEQADYITDSWDVISQRSIAGTAQNYYSVGDCKPIELNGTMGTLTFDHETLYVYILGFNHNSTYEPNGITFGGFKTAATNGVDVALCDNYYNSTSTDGSKWFNQSHWGNYNYGGWKGSDMRYDILGSTNVQPSGYGSTPATSKVGYDATSTCATTPVDHTLMSCLPSDLRAAMKPMTKYTDNKGNSSNTSGNVTSSIDYLPLLSEFEIQGNRTYANQYEQNKQAQYAYYSAGNSKVKYNHSEASSAVAWWARSPYYGDNSLFCGVNTGGAADGSLARYSRGVAPAFLIGGAPIEYTINYYSQDGQTLLHTETVNEFEDAIYSTIPTKQSTAQYNYTFAGWSETINSTTATQGITENISQNLNLYAAFTPVERTFTVYFYNEDTLLQTVTNVSYGGTAAYTGQTPTKTDYVFSGWSPSNTNVTENRLCYAQFVVAELAETITDSWSEIFANEANGTYSTKYSVGDTKLIDLGTEGQVLMQIVAMNTDLLASDNTKKAPITWISKQLLKTSHKMHSTTSNYLSDWSNCEMRTYLKSTIYPLIPQEIRNNIKEVTKYTNKRTGSTTYTTVSSTEDIWLPSYREVSNNTSYCETSGVQYNSIFTDNTSRLKHKVGESNTAWWTRSASGYSGSSGSYFFAYVDSGGGTYYDGNYCTLARGVAIGFCT